MIMPMLSVKDVDASVQFYTEKLGFKTSVLMKGASGEHVFAIVQLGQAHLGLGAILEEHNIPEPRGAGVSFMVYVPEDTDIDAHYEAVKAKGVPIAEAIKTEYWGDRVYSVKDPDGYHLTMTKTVKQVSNEEIQEHMRNNG